MDNGTCKSETHPLGCECMLAPRMPKYVHDDTQDRMVRFGTSGWSSWFIYSGEVDMDRMRELCQNKIPESVRESHPENREVKWIKIYKEEESWLRVS